MAKADELGIAGSSGFVVAVGASVVAAGLALAGLRFVGGTPLERGVEGATGALALGAVVAAPGVLTMLAASDRPAMLLPAASVLIPLSFLSFALVTLPLLIPAVMLLISYGRRSVGYQAVGTAAGTFLAVVVLLAGAVVVLFIHRDPRSYTTATGGGSTSDVITYGESLSSLALTSCALASGWVLAAPRARR